MRLVIYKDNAGEWRWRRVAGNNEIVADSGEGYENYADAHDMATRQFPDDAIQVRLEGEAGAGDPDTTEDTT